MRCRDSESFQDSLDSSTCGQGTCACAEGKRGKKEITESKEGHFSNAGGPRTAQPLFGYVLRRCCCCCRPYALRALDCFPVVSHGFRNSRARASRIWPRDGSEMSSRSSAGRNSVPMWRLANQKSQRGRLFKSETASTVFFIFDVEVPEASLGR